ncbi:MAG: tRNA threonylcarbamoyladenosine dehydratase [Oscillospiraceae bacterium]|nr:tRNA threonylcarbamoyladenosine dehydratase [Oscillospiraceae bacterium]
MQKNEGTEMGDWLARQRMLVGDGGCEILRGARVAVIGLGGVGGAAFEALVRAGVGHLLAMDRDVFDETNLNRQLLATRETVGCGKAQTAAARALSIDPTVDVRALCETFGESTQQQLLDFRPDYVVDAIDMVSAKLLLIELCGHNGIPIISSMGTGNRLTASFVVGDIRETAGCGCALARVMRRELKKRGVENVTVLYGTAPPLETGQRTPGSVSFVPPVAGYLIAGYVVRQLLDGNT